MGYNGDTLGHIGTENLGKSKSSGVPRIFRMAPKQIPMAGRLCRFRHSERCGAFPSLAMEGGFIAGVVKCIKNNVENSLHMFAYLMFA